MARHLIRGMVVILLAVIALLLAALVYSVREIAADVDRSAAAAAVQCQATVRASNRDWFKAPDLTVCGP